MTDPGVRNPFRSELIRSPVTKQPAKTWPAPLTGHQNESVKLPRGFSFFFLGMAVPCIILLGSFLVDSMGESVATTPLVSECCSDVLLINGSCPMSNRCSPGCYRVWAEDGKSSCVLCKNETSLQATHNVTACLNVTSRTTNVHVNMSATQPVPHNLGNPGIAALLLIGTLFISLFLVLSVASFFYLKRSQKLPEIFYRRNKASILQPSEMAAMIPEQKPTDKNLPGSEIRKNREGSGRKPRNDLGIKPVLIMNGHTLLPKWIMSHNVGNLSSRREALTRSVR
uniref:Chromosome 1 open reading frame 159 n=1 Tax=Leptobrachium leishanense TaxID=445787 RepID=A0A8C5N4S3_9ANUR